MICGACCQGLHRAVAADLIYIGAIMDMRSCGYHHVTLEKKLMPTVSGNPNYRNCFEGNGS